MSEDLDAHLKKTARALRPFARAGYQLFPLAKASKVPRDRGWQTISYDLADIGRWMAQGGNVGVRLRDVDLVLDVDPRNAAPGDDPFRRLCDAVGVDLADAPTVWSGRGDGGRHIYLRKPATLQIGGKLEGYRGIDIRTAGSLVVAPGSRHPDTGGIYEVDDLTRPIGKAPAAPAALLDLLARPAIEQRTGHAGAAAMTAEQLAESLSALDPIEYGTGRYDEWIRLAASCHDATGGAGLPAFLAWCAGDPVYADEVSQERVAKHWESFQAGRPGGVTYRTLLRAVVDAGRADLVAEIDQVPDSRDFDAAMTTRAELAGHIDAVRLTARKGFEVSDFDRGRHVLANGHRAGGEEKSDEHES